MVKWRLFVERWEDGYLGYRVRDVDEGESLHSVIDHQLSQQPTLLRLTISFIGNPATKDSNGNPR